MNGWRTARWIVPTSGIALLLLLSVASASAAPPEADRRAILAMTGDFDVTFDLKEVLSLRAGYKTAEPKLAHGHEIVRVIEDTGSTIELQHLLVRQRDGVTDIVKHWRQDWTFEPQSVLAYDTSGVWKVQSVAQNAARGRWSQTVWQTDDSPRYGALGTWHHENGFSEWTSDKTLRPLPRRDATRHPPYAFYEAINRHVISPSGWAHEQWNTKLGMADGKSVAYADEMGINTYTRATVAGVAQAEAYWSKTKDYWADVRKAWDEAASDGVVRVTEEADSGSVIAERLMGLADDIAAGKQSREGAAGAARKLIAEADNGKSPAGSN